MTKTKKVKKNHIHRWRVEIWFEGDEESDTCFPVAICSCGRSLDSSEIEIILNMKEREQMKQMEE